MSIYIENSKAILFKGDYLPASLKKGNISIAGYQEQTFSGQSLAINNTYNDKPSGITIHGGFAPGKNLFNINNIKQTSGMATNFEFKAGQTYTISFNFTGNNSQEIAFGIIGSYFKIAHFAPNSQPKSITTTITPSIDTYLTVYFGGTPSVSQFERTFSVYALNFQIEHGNEATEYEPYITPPHPVMTWNNTSFEIPLPLKIGNSVIVSENSVIAHLDEITDITNTDIGNKLLSLKTTPTLTTASISNGTLDISLKIPE